jgi:cyclohexa-1,5-dienecarbonyl-CoA hydratase
MADFKNIGFEEKNKVAYITLKREDLNILNIEMMSEINSALESLDEGKKIRALVFKAEGKAFSAGVDVSDHTTDLVNKMIDTFHRMFRLLDKMECPTVALVHGAALGGGCELACFCDMVLAAAGVKFGQPEIKVGVFPPVAAPAFPQSMALKKVYELLLTGDVIKAEEAMAVGLVNQVYPREEFEKSSEEFIYRLACNSGAILRLTKKAIRGSLGKPFAEGLDISEQIYLEEMMATKDAHEGLAAFMEKRPAKWTDE